MSLPTPPLDPRARDTMLLDAARAVTTAQPGWGNPQPDDPGIALIQVCADMAVRLADRVNRAPDRHRADMARRLGPRPLPGSPAVVSMRFHVRNPTPPNVVRIPAGTEIATPGQRDAVVFTTLTDAEVPARSLTMAGSFMGTEHDGVFDGTLLPWSPTSGRANAGGVAWTPPHARPPRSFVAAVSARDAPAHTTQPLVVLSAPVPGAWITLDLRVGTQAPPHRDVTYAWAAWQGTHWADCSIVTDTTADLTRDGRVTLAVPDVHAPARLTLPGGTWEGVGLLRPRHVHDSSVLPHVIVSVTMAAESSIVVPAAHARMFRDERLGTATGRPDERFRFAHPPLPHAGHLAVDVVSGDASPAQRWTYVDSLARTGPHDRHFTLDVGTGEAVFAATGEDRTGRRRHGALLPPGATVRATTYLFAGDHPGNVPQGTVTVLRTPIPEVIDVSNLTAAVGGAGPESALACAARAPLGTAFPERAVTPADYERLALAASAGVARAHHLPAVPGDLLDPARNLRAWSPATTTLTFTLAPGVEGLDTGARAGTPDTPSTVFTTTAPVARTRTQAAMTGLRFAQKPTPTKMFTDHTLDEPHTLRGKDTVGAGTANDIGLILARVPLPPHTPRRNLTLWVTRADPVPDHTAPVALSVFVENADDLWWDIDTCHYTAPPPVAVSLGTHTAAYPVSLTDAATWRDVYGSLDLPDQAPDALILQIHDPRRTPETSYTVWVDNAGGTASARQCDRGDTTRSAISQGMPDQHFDLLDAPIVGATMPDVTVTPPKGPAQVWKPVPDFTGCTDTSRNVVINASTGRIHFGPAISGPSGTRQYGAVPPAGAEIKVSGEYTTSRGHVSIPVGAIDVNVGHDPKFVAVTNAQAVADGTDGYTDTSGGAVRLGVRLLVIPSVTPDAQGRFPRSSLTPTPHLIDELLSALSPLHPPEAPLWAGLPGLKNLWITADLEPVAPLSPADRDDLRAAAERALYRHFSAVEGGPDGTGWPLGRPARVGEAHLLLAAVPGPTRVIDVRLYDRDPTDPASAPVDTVTCADTECVYSVEHRVRILDANL
ncbi:baseplate J/gp47 family protein [Embleya sp. NPDC059259]|uniref:baseplate J/gp47 family protein n=1 Tax=unclassified Embleya TaxID=2699296 RepID=UPI003679F517